MYLRELFERSMKKDRPLILISNDDGVNAKGLKELIRFLRPMGDLVVMAPDAPRSGFACSISCYVPVSYELVHEEEGLVVYKCSGTPTDCTKLAFYSVLDRNPDLVIGGINHGDNSSVNVHYSGTMGVVIEGCLRGFPSIGFSLCDHGLDADFAPLERYVQRITKKVLEEGLPSLTCLNVNFPKASTFKGVKICQQAKGLWIKEWIKREDQEGHVFDMAGVFMDTDADCELNDHWALRNGYVAITPTTVDATDYEMIKRMNDWF